LLKREFLMSRFSLALVFSCTAALSVQMSYAQESPAFCVKTLIDKPYEVHIEGSFVNKYKSRIHTSILWKHHGASADSFYIAFPNENAGKSKIDSMLFVTDGNFRRLYMPQENAIRNFATHHLKENIGNSPLVFDDLDLLASGQYLCPDQNKNNAPNKFSTAFSQAWYTLIADSEQNATELKMFGSKSHKRTLSILGWSTLGEVKLPTAVRVTGNNYYGMLWVHSAYSLEKKENYEGPLATQSTQSVQSVGPVVKEAEPVLVLELDNELLGNTAVVKALLAPSENARSDSHTLFPFVPGVDSTGKSLGVSK